MGYIFSFIAFLILIPVVMKLPLGIKSSSKIMILIFAFALSILGILAIPFLGVFKVALVLLLLSILLVFLLEKRVIETSVAIGVTSEPLSSKPKNNMIIVQDQDGDAVEQGSYITDQNENEIEEDVGFLEKRHAQVETGNAFKEVAPTEASTPENDIDDWLNSVSEDIDDAAKNRINVGEITIKDTYTNELAEELTPLGDFVFETIEVKVEK